MHLPEGIVPHHAEGSDVCTIYTISTDSTPVLWSSENLMEMTGPRPKKKVDVVVISVEVHLWSALDEPKVVQI